VSLALSFELRVEERGADRVVVSVLLAPTAAAIQLDGVALQLHSRVGEPLGSRMLLPIAGELRHPMLSTVELRTADALPQGSKVVGTAWAGAEQRESSIPTDPFTELEVHLRARRRISPIEDERSLRRLDRTERCALAKNYPWVDEPRLPTTPSELAVVDDQETVDAFDDLVEDLGLDDESAAWLKELLDDDDALQG